MNARACKFGCGRPAAWTHGRLAGVCVECKPAADERFREAIARAAAARRARSDGRALNPPPPAGGTTLVRTDPPARADGRCVVCLKRRKLAKASPVNAEHRRHAAADPFCSTECCRSYHGCPLKAEPIDEPVPVGAAA